MKATSQPALAGVRDKLLLATVPQACGCWASRSRQGQKGRTAAGAGRRESCRGCTRLRRRRRRRHRAGSEDQQAGQHKCARHAASPCHCCAGGSSQQPGSALCAQDDRSSKHAKPVPGSVCCSASLERAAAAGAQWVADGQLMGRMSSPPGGQQQSGVPEAPAAQAASVLEDMRKKCS
jgi:hypothetical protein